MTPSRDLSCEEMLRRLDEYLDRALTEDDAELVAEHLARCAECAGEFRFESQLMEEIRGKLDRIELSPGLASRIFARLGREDT